MGIRGLTAYIWNHSERFLEIHALHNTYLVIDGNCIACQLYMTCTKSNCIFGGDYDKYAQCVSEFFEELLKCNITPLVIIDGGCEDKKLKTVISRMKEKIERASYYTVASQHKNKFFPLLLREVFKDVMNEKGIKYVQCMFEADNTIAAIARILDCPVLSYDSDFYIYGSLYIPFNTWENVISRNSSGTGYVKYCKIYYVQKLLQFFSGLNLSLLPLASILLGNDYVKQHTFKNFFRHLKLSQTKKTKYSDQQRRIETTFNWLRKHNLNQAVIGILSRLQRQERKRVLNIIETMLNGYFTASLSVLHLLDIPSEHYSKKIEHIPKTYKFQGDIYNLTYIEENSNETDLSDDDETNDKEITNILQGKEMISDELLVNTLPQWFIDEFKLGRFPPYFIDIIIRKLYICPIQIENYSHPTSINASLNIISVIYALLMSKDKEKKTCLEYMTRDENKKIKCYKLEYSNTPYGYRLPLLSNLRQLPIIIRREIINVTLGIDCENYLHEIPSNWMLYIAIIKYWINRQKEPCNLNCHIYSLLFAMLFTIIDYNVGIYRNLNKFRNKFDKTIENIQYTRRMKNYNPQYSSDATFKDAFDNINADDCLIAASCFVFHFEMDQKLYAQPKKMNITIVHGFAEFQNCLRHGMNLNALLGYPYEQTKIANLFNGTLLYNLCNNFKRRDDIEAYINVILKNSPSLLHLFNVFLSKVKPLFGMILEKKANKLRKHRTKKHNREKCIISEENDDETHENKESEEIFYDANNPFSILNVPQH
ncbi:hypothetical protein HN011_005734 [Eciton burchellii]|nr:hypothetical protein HN011_005734 [Eciton burchellii]